MKRSIKDKKVALANRARGTRLKSRYRRHGCMCGNHRMKDQPFPFLPRIRRVSGGKRR